jgi:hypothetical protein
VRSGFFGPAGLAGDHVQDRELLEALRVARSAPALPRCAALRVDLLGTPSGSRRGSIRNVLRAARQSSRVISDPYFVVTARSASDRSLKSSPSFVQKPLWESTVSRLTPRTTACRSSYLARSRWKLCASTVQPEVKSFG